MEKSSKKNEHFYYLDNICTAGKGSSQWRERIVTQFGDISRCVFSVETIQDISAYINKLVEEFNANKRLKYKYVKNEFTFLISPPSLVYYDIYIGAGKENTEEDVLGLYFKVIRNGSFLQIKQHQG